MHIHTCIPMDTVLLFNGALPACAPAHHTAAVRHRSAQRTDRGAMQSINMNTQCSTDHPDVWQDGWHAHRHHCWQRCQGMAAARHHGRARPTAAVDCTKILACRRVIRRRRNKGGGAPQKQSQCSSTAAPRLHNVLHLTLDNVLPATLTAIFFQLSQLSLAEPWLYFLLTFKLVNISDGLSSHSKIGNAALR